MCSHDSCRENPTNLTDTLYIHFQVPFSQISEIRFGCGFYEQVYIYCHILYIYYVIYSFLCDNTMQSTPAKAEDKYSGELQLIRLHSCFISLWCLHGTQHENEHVFKQYLKNWIHKRAIIKGKEKPKRI